MKEKLNDEKLQSVNGGVIGENTAGGGQKQYRAEWAGPSFSERAIVYYKGHGNEQFKVLKVHANYASQTAIYDIEQQSNQTQYLSVPEESLGYSEF